MQVRRPLERIEGSEGAYDFATIAGAGHPPQRPPKRLADMSDRDHADARRRRPARPVRRRPIEHPAALAAETRCAMSGAARTAPVSATSPTKADPAGGATPVAADTSAAATARSHAGSSSRTPPDEAPNSSDRPSGIPAPRSRTAATSWNRRGSSPVACRLAGPSAAPTSAWTSTARARRPACGSAMAAPGAGEPDTSRLGRVDLRQPSRPHLEPCRLALGAEPVLAAREDPKTRARIPVERQDHVDGVLQRPRTGQIAVLRHVAGEEHGDAVFLGQPDERVGAHPDLRDGPPGIWVPDVSRSVWMESTASRNGRPPARCPARARDRDRERTRWRRRRRRAAGRVPPPARAIPRPTPARRSARPPTGARARGAAASTCRCRARRRAAPRRPGRRRRRARDRCRRSRSRHAVRRPGPTPASPATARPRIGSRRRRRTRTSSIVPH